MLNPDERGLVPTYNGGPCPACNAQQWIVGLSTAECAGCGVALPRGARSGAPVMKFRGPDGVWRVGQRVTA